MPRGRVYSDDVTDVLSHVRRAFDLNSTQASRVTGISRRTVQRRFRPHHTSARPRSRGLGQPRKLNDDDVSVSETVTSPIRRR